MFPPVKPWQKRCSTKCNSVASNTRVRKDPTLKTCRTCKQSLPVEGFELAHRSCRECEQLQEAGLKRCRGCRIVKEHGDFTKRSGCVDGRESRCKTCRSEAAKRRNADPVQKARNRDVKYRLKYGIGEAEVEEMRRRQGGRCAICQKEKASRLHVDHDHKTGAVRDLLCSHCNSILGYCNDNRGVLQSAIQYIERHASHAQMES